MAAPKNSATNHETAPILHNVIRRTADDTPPNCVPAGAVSSPGRGSDAPKRGCEWHDYLEYAGRGVLGGDVRWKLREGLGVCDLAGAYGVALRGRAGAPQQHRQMRRLPQGTGLAPPPR